MAKTGKVLRCMTEKHFDCLEDTMGRGKDTERGGCCEKSKLIYNFVAGWW